MEYLLALAAGFGVYLFSKHIQRRARERRELRWFSWDDDFADISSGWRFDLVAMTAEDRFSQPGQSHRRPNQLQRDGSGVWRVRPTYESWSADVADVNEMRNNFVPEQTIAERLQWLGPEPTWRELPPNIAAPLESQYQRFLLHYRE